MSRRPTGISFLLRGMMLILMVSSAASAGSQESTVAVVDTSLTTQELRFPTFEPFQESRMWEFLLLQADTSREAALRHVKELNAALDSRQEFEDEFFSFETDSVRIGGELSFGEGMWYKFLPNAIMAAQPLTKGHEWTTLDYQIALEVSEFISRGKNSPRFEFRKDDHARNRRQLKALAEWSLRTLGNPEEYALMVFTFDDGPWRAPTLPADVPLKTTSVRNIGEELSLSLMRTLDSNNYWCMRGIKDDSVMWTRVLTKVPTDREFVFSKKDPPATRVGDYGWKVHMSFGEYTHVYLSEHGEFLFYFTSW